MNLLIDITIDISLKLYDASATLLARVTFEQRLLIAECHQRPLTTHITFLASYLPLEHHTSVFRAPN